MNTSSTRLATCVPVVTSPLSVVRAAQFSWPTHKRLRGDAEGPLLAEGGSLALSGDSPLPLHSSLHEYSTEECGRGACVAVIAGRD